MYVCMSVYVCMYVCMYNCTVLLGDIVCVAVGFVLIVLLPVDSNAAPLLPNRVS